MVVKHSPTKTESFVNEMSQAGNNSLIDLTFPQQNNNVEESEAPVELSAAGGVDTRGVIFTQTTFANTTSGDATHTTAVHLNSKISVGPVSSQPNPNCFPNMMSQNSQSNLYNAASDSMFINANSQSLPIHPNPYFRNPNESFEPDFNMSQGCFPMAGMNLPNFAPQHLTSNPFVPNMYPQGFGNWTMPNYYNIRPPNAFGHSQSFSAHQFPQSLLAQANFQDSVKLQQNTSQPSVNFQDSRNYQPTELERDLSISTSSVASGTRHKIKLPSFWKELPKGWFEFIEAKFTKFYNVSDEDKYQAVVDVLDPDVRQEIRDILEKPPLIDKYITLRNRLEDVYKESEKSRINKLLSTIELGGRKPSQLLRHMQGLAGSGCDSLLIKQIWEHRLPKPVQVGIAALPRSYTVEECARVADDVFEALEPNQIYAVSAEQQKSFNSKSSNFYGSGIEGELLKQLSQITKQLAELTTTMARERNSRSRDRSGQRERSQSRNSDTKAGMCWHHMKFGEKAVKCSKTNCTFEKSNKSTDNQENKKANR